MTTKIFLLGAAAVGSLVLCAGCAKSPTSANTVSRSETGRAHRVQGGEVIYVREVTIEGESQGGGGFAGGVIGFAVGDTIGGGRGRRLARVGGAAVGAAAGSAIEQAASTVAGVEVTVELDDGEVIVVIQAADEVFEVGDYVRVIRRSDGGVRVVQ